MSEIHTPDYKRLGKLASAGPKEPWQVALLLPESYFDLKEIPLSALELDEKLLMPIRLSICSQLTTHYNSRPSRLTFTVKDGLGQTFKATIFGGVEEAKAQLENRTEALFLATAKPWGSPSALYLTISEIVDDVWADRIRPTYPAKRQVISPEDARVAVYRLLDESIPIASNFIIEQLKSLAPIEQILADCGAKNWTLEQIFYQAHIPSSLDYAAYASTILQRLAALANLNKMHEGTASAIANPIDLARVDERIAQMPWALTNDQRDAIYAIKTAIASKKKPAHIIVCGEVGTGKTATAAVILAALADADNQRHRGLLISPNSTLAKQLYNEITGFFPDLNCKLVVGETPKSDDLEAQILIGTTALLHRNLGVNPFSLVIVDEQHRMSREQREHHVKNGTHLVELSATPIPRTQALARFGRVSIVEMRQVAYPKTFITKLYLGGAGARDLFNEIAPSINSGDPVLVVYPQREGGDLGNAGGIDPRHSIEQAKERWERLFPGKVLTLTSDDNAESKELTLQAFAERKANILVCTTVVEIGLNLRSLYRIVIVCPERHGLMTLHQLRGRTARNGGEGYCHLLCPDPITDDSLEKLNTFCEISDGFALADYDLRRRGVGDLSSRSSKQSGADDTFLFGTKLDIELLDQVTPVWQKLINS